MRETAFNLLDTLELVGGRTGPESAPNQSHAE